MHNFLTTPFALINSNIDPYFHKKKPRKSNINIIELYNGDDDDIPDLVDSSDEEE